MTAKSRRRRSRRGEMNVDSGAGTPDISVIDELPAGSAQARTAQTIIEEIQNGHTFNTAVAVASRALDGTGTSLYDWDRGKTAARRALGMTE